MRLLRFQYRLRTLFLTTFLVALFMGGFVSVQRAREQAETVRQLESLGAVVRYRIVTDSFGNVLPDPPVSDWLPAYLSRDLFEHVQYAEVRTDVQLSQATAFSHLKSLVCNIRPREPGGVAVPFLSSVTTDGLRQVRRFKMLNSLHALFVPADDEVLAELKHLPELTDLALNARRLTDEGFRQLEEFPKLRKLILMDARFDSENASTLSRLKGLKELCLSRSTVTVQVMEAISELAGLETLRLYSTSVRGAELRRLLKMPALRTLCVQPCDDDVTSTIALFEHLETVEISRLRESASADMAPIPPTVLTDAGLIRLRSLSRLDELRLFDIEITDQVLEVLRDIPRLRRLTLAATELSDAKAAQLESLKLEQLDMIHTSISPEALSRLRKCIPVCRLNGHATEPDTPKKAAWRPEPGSKMIEVNEDCPRQVDPSCRDGTTAMP